jgi:poly-gamma-glutamate synthesis protein (capsule biosynthesis protein)
LVSEDRPRPSLTGIVSIISFLLVFFLAFFCNKNRRTSDPEAVGFGATAKADTVAPAKSLQLSVAAVGDVMMAGSALSVILAKGIDYPFDSTRAALQKADIAIANLEAPFGTSGSPFNKTFTFRVPPAFAPGLVNAGFDVVNLANNHILDYGLSPFFQTLQILDSLGIAACGAGANRDSAEAGTVLIRNGWKVAFLGFSLTYPEQFWAASDKPGTAFAEEGRIVQRIDSLRSKVDLIVVSFHWGKELQTFPEPYQRSFAHAAIDAGADLVLGHHPHVPQGFELHKGKPIAYSLGNFVFGSESASCRESVLFVATFDSAGFVRADVIPVSVNYKKVQYQPRMLRGSAKDALIRSLNRMSQRFNGGKDILSQSGEMLKRKDRVTQSRDGNL